MAIILKPYSKVYSLIGFPFNCLRHKTCSRIRASGIKRFFLFYFIFMSQQKSKENKKMKYLFIRLDLSVLTNDL